MTDNEQFDGEHPFTRPEGSDASMFIQWKGTDVCMDFVCQCGADVHGDGYFAHNVECGACGAFYQLGTQVIAKRVEVPDGACLYLSTDEDDYTPAETVTLPGGQEATVIATVAEGKYLWSAEHPELATGGFVEGPTDRITIDLGCEYLITADDLKKSPSLKAALEKFGQSIQEVKDQESREGDSPNT